MIIDFCEMYLTNEKELCLELSVPNNIEKKEKILLILKEGYKRWGENLPIYLKGYFSFCINDTENDIWFGARDRFGVIPFYYVVTNGKLFCDCYIKNVLKKSEVQKKLNLYALQMYMSFSFSPGVNTFYEDILKLMPGQTITYKNRELSIKQYNEYSYHGYKNKKFELWKKQLQLILKNNVKKMETGNENGVFLLSSGVDSNYLFALSSISKAFALGTEYPEFDESKKALKNAKTINKNCEIISINSQQFFDSIVEAENYMEQPIGTASSVAYMYICKQISKFSSICYTGEGADELFAGYEIYGKSHLFGKDIYYLGKAHIFGENEKKKLIKNYIGGFNAKMLVEKICSKNNYNNTEEYLNHMLDVDVKLWLEADSLVNSFKMSRAFGIETRMPFITEDLFEFAYSMPSKFKWSGNMNKYILREASKTILPDDIAFYKKQGFIIPIRYWLKEEKYKKDMYSMLNNEMVSKIFNINEISSLYDEFLKGNQKLWRKVWLIYSFLKWYILNFDYDNEV